jgi:hypothetical protein
MMGIYSWVKQGLIALGITALLIAGLMLAVVFARPLMIVGLVAAFGAVLASVFSPRLRARLESSG